MFQSMDSRKANCFLLKGFQNQLCPLFDKTCLFQPKELVSWLNCFFLAGTVNLRLCFMKQFMAPPLQTTEICSVKNNPRTDPGG